MKRWWHNFDIIWAWGLSVQSKKLKKWLLTYSAVRRCRAEPLRDGCVYGSINCAFYGIAFILCQLKASIEFPQIIQSLSSIFKYKVSQWTVNLSMFIMIWYQGESLDAHSIAYNTFMIYGDTITLTTRLLQILYKCIFLLSFIHNNNTMILSGTILVPVMIRSKQGIYGKLNFKIWFCNSYAILEI